MTTTTTTTTAALSAAEENARGHVDSICRLWVDHQEARSDSEVEEVEQEAREQALSVQVRSGWHDPGQAPAMPEEGCVLLSTGGPALRLLVELDCDGEACEVTLEHQDWGTPWTRFPLTGAQEEAFEWFAGLFWFAG